MNERTAMFVDAIQRLDVHDNNGNNMKKVFRSSKEHDDDDDNTTITTAVETRDASAASESKQQKQKHKHQHQHQTPGHRRASSSCSSISGPVFLWTKGDTPPVELGVPTATAMPSSLLAVPLEPSSRRTRTRTTTRRHQRHQSFQEELFLDNFYTTGSLNDGSVDAASSTRSHVSMPIDLDVMDDYYKYSGQLPWTTVGVVENNKDNDEEHSISGEKQEIKMEPTKHHRRVVDLDDYNDIEDPDDDDDEDDDENDKYEPLPLIRNPLCRRPSGGIDALVRPPNRMTRFEI